MKDAHQAQVEAQLRIWAAKLEVLKATAAKATAEARIELGRQIDELKRLETDGLTHLEELKKSSAAAWESVKSGVEGKWHQLTAAGTALWDKLG